VGSGRSRAGGRRDEWAQVRQECDQWRHDLCALLPPTFWDVMPDWHDASGSALGASSPSSRCVCVRARVRVCVCALYARNGIGGGGAYRLRDGLQEHRSHWCEGVLTGLVLCPSLACSCLSWPNTQRACCHTTLYTPPHPYPDPREPHPPISRAHCKQRVFAAARENMGGRERLWGRGGLFKRPRTLVRGWWLGHTGSRQHSPLGCAIPSDHSPEAACSPSFCGRRGACEQRRRDAGYGQSASTIGSGRGWRSTAGAGQGKGVVADRESLQSDDVALNHTVLP
jgi:hypothetical protein